MKHAIGDCFWWLFFVFDEGTNKFPTCFWKLVQIFSEGNMYLVREGVIAERLYEEMMKSFTEEGVPAPAKHCGVWVGGL